VPINVWQAPSGKCFSSGTVIHFEALEIELRVKCYPVFKTPMHVLLIWRDLIAARLLLFPPISPLRPVVKSSSYQRTKAVKFVKSIIHLLKTHWPLVCPAFLDPQAHLRGLLKALKLPRTSSLALSSPLSHLQLGFVSHSQLPVAFT
jgi:hypothetical protein